MDKFYDDIGGIERYLNLPKNSLSNIPAYALQDAVDAIIKVREMERTSLFRPGLYYIVLTDLCGNTAFNAKYGDAEGDLRTEWFQTAAIQSIGEIEVRNYIAFSKTIGDASLLVFSSFNDVFDWSETFSNNLSVLTNEYAHRLMVEHSCEEKEIESRVADFTLRARRLVHLGEVSFKEDIDPLSLAVSSTFKIEKNFAETDLGCTQPVADAIRPKIAELGLELRENHPVTIPGTEDEVMTYYVVRPERKR